MRHHLWGNPSGRDIQFRYELTWRWRPFIHVRSTNPIYVTYRQCNIVSLRHLSARRSYRDIRILLRGHTSWTIFVSFPPSSIINISAPEQTSPKRKHGVFLSAPKAIMQWPQFLQGIQEPLEPWVPVLIRWRRSKFISHLFSSIALSVRTGKAWVLYHIYISRSRSLLVAIWRRTLE
jgi:hypothetical protein